MLRDRLLLLHGYTGGVSVAAGIAGLALQGVGLPRPGESSSSVWTGGPGPVDTPRPAAHRVDLQLGHVLQLGDACQLQIQRVHHHPGHYVDNVEEQPDEEHNDVVGKYHVVDDESVNPGNDSPGSKDAHGDQPRLEPSLLLQSESVESDTGTDEHGHGPDQS